MHLYTLCKIKDDDPESARNILQDLLENHTGNEHHFDYVGEIKQVVKVVENQKTEESLASYADGQPPFTFKNLEKKYKEYTKSSLSNYSLRVKEALFTTLTEYFLSPEEAPLYVSNEDEKVRVAISKVLAGKHKDLSFDQKLDCICKSLIWDSMFGWYINQAYDLKTLIDSDDISGLLENGNIHFIDLTQDDEYNLGKHTYYFMVDRHS